tara:strand:- start:195 stop:440 length:246 start_codon:yes stop_codon:yes gene_type:complete
MKESFKTLNLHGIRHFDVKGKVEDFILRNFTALPIMIITGNSFDMQALVKEVVVKHNLRMTPEHANNMGSYIINQMLTIKK